MPHTHRLSLFLDVVQQGSFTKAAALNDMDNSSLSKQIKKLESDLGVQLLARSTRSFSLTPVGEDILEQTQKLIGTLDYIQDIANSYQLTPKGSLKITSPIYFGQEHLQPVITQFIKQHPDVQITLSLDDRKNDLITDHVDLAFRLGKLTDSNLIAKKLSNAHFAILASNTFVEKHGTPNTVDELIALPAVIYANGDITLDQLTIAETARSNTMRTCKMVGNYRVSDVNTMIRAVKDGLGYTVLDLSNLSGPIADQGLVALLTDHTLSTRETAIYALYPHKKQTMLVKTFIQAVQDYVGTPPRWQAYIPNYTEMYR